MVQNIENIDPKEYIIVKGANVHNLKNIDLVIPKNKLVVVTGLSGSGKSSLAFDTIFAEGQRRYVESLSSYARQFMGKLNKPEVEYIKGITPAIAIEQKVISSNARSTVGTVTEIYDYLKLLYARIGQTYSPVSGELVKKDDVSTVVDFLQSLEIGTRCFLLTALEKKEDRTFLQQLEVLQQQGFVRIKIGDKVQKIQDLIDFGYDTDDLSNHYLVIDRFSTKSEEEFYHRVSDSISLAFYEGKGICSVQVLDGEGQMQKESSFSNLFEKDGITFIEPSLHFFTFNNPLGACPKCEGYGSTVGIDEDLVIPEQHLSVYEDAVAPWKGDKMQEYKQDFIRIAGKLDFPIHKPYMELSDEQKKLLWEPSDYFDGLDGFFEMLEQNSYKIQYRVMLSRYRGKTECPECGGKRLRKETNYVKVGDKNISELVDVPLDELKPFFDSLELSDYQKKIADRIFVEIRKRVQFLLDVGLGYLTLNRAANTLSGGESQRINLATSLGSSLVGSTYILDEPSIGLHSRDTERLITVLQSLRDLGNTVIVVEHDEDVIKAADYIVDIGPKAGTEGGNVVFTGTYDQLLKKDTLTTKFLSNPFEIAPNTEKKIFAKNIKALGINARNIENVDLNLPLDGLIVISGVSGSGKSTLLKEVIFPAIGKKIGHVHSSVNGIHSLEGDWDSISQIEIIDQNPIGKSSRSNPVTYIKAYDDIRTLFAKQKLSQMMDYKSKHFSFNTDGGRCDSCKGDGTVTVEMQFLADIELTCEECNGKRFKKEILEVRFEQKNIADILEMKVDQAIEFFEQNNQKKIANKLKALQAVGLGYLALGQPSSTLSGGEAQRIKLASFLTKATSSEKILFLFDEPSTGLHFYDVQILLKAFRALIEKGHTVYVIEHHLDIIKSADWIIDIGPEAGKNGGQIVAEGTPSDFKDLDTHTAKFLKEKLA